MLKKYTKQEVLSYLTQLNTVSTPSWELKSNKLHKLFIFSNFLEAFEFMKQIAQQAEILNHHPDWKNCYNQVEINLTTHKFSGISKKDFELAYFIEELFIKHKNSKN